MKLYIRGKEHDKDLIDSVLNGPFQYGTVVEDGIPWTKTYKELTNKRKFMKNATFKLPILFFKVYHRMCTILSTITLLLKKFRIESSYLWKAQNCHCKNVSASCTMSLTGLILRKFVNNLQPEWSKFVIDVKLAKDMPESNFDQLYVYLRQHEVHANEVKMMCERFPNPLALVFNYHHTPSNYNNHHSHDNLSQYQQQLSPIAQQLYNSHQQPLSYEALAHQQAYQSLAIHQTSMIPQQAYQSPAFQQQPQTVFSQQEPGLIVPSFLLDAFDSDYDEALFVGAVRMANLSNYDSHILSEDFDKGLHIEINEMKGIFNQMKYEVEQCFVDKKCFDIQKKERFLENDRLLELIISQDLVHTAMNSYAVIVDYQNMEKSYIEEYNDMVDKSIYNEISNTCSKLETQCISLEVKLQQSKESFQNNRACKNQDVPDF
ncbi:hypothetical protein Tco_0767609 [Tanacetum coccineum]